MPLVLIAALLQQDPDDWETKVPPHLTQRLPDLPKRLAALRQEDVPKLIQDLHLEYGYCPYPWILRRLIQFEGTEIAATASRSSNAVIRPILRDYLLRLDADGAASERHTDVSHVLRPDDLPTIRDVILRSKKPNSRIHGLRMLARLGTSEARKAIAEMARDEEAAVRIEALQALAELKSDLLEAAARAALADASPRVRFAAAKLLCPSGNADALKVLLDVAHSQDPAALGAALFLAETCPEKLDSKTAERLLPVARERARDWKDREVVSEALAFLALRGSPQDRDMVIDLVLIGGASASHETTILRAVVTPALLPELLARADRNGLDWLRLASICDALPPERILALADTAIEIASQPRVRSAALSFLATLAERDAVPSRRDRLVALAREVLRDPYDPGYESACEIALALDDTECADMAARNLDRAPSRAAFSLLSAKRPPEAVPTLRKFIREGEVYLHKCAIRTLIDYGAPDAGTLGLDFIEKHGEKHSFEGLDKVMRPEHRTRILKMLQEPRTEWSIIDLLSMLAPIATREDVPLVRKYLTDEREDVCRAALRIAARLKDRSLLPEIRKVARSSHYWASEAIDALREILGKEGSADYAALLLAENVAVRERAARACGTFGVTDAAATLEGIVRTDVWAGREALPALVLLRDPAALPLVRDVRDWGRYDDQVARALGEIGEDADLVWLFARAEEREWERSRWLRAIDGIVNRAFYGKYRRPIEIPAGLRSIDDLARELKARTGTEVTISEQLRKSSPERPSREPIARPSLRAVFDELGDPWRWPSPPCVAVVQGDRIALLSVKEAFDYWLDWRKRRK